MFIGTLFADAGALMEVEKTGVESPMDMEKLNINGLVKYWSCLPVQGGMKSRM